MKKNEKPKNSEQNHNLKSALGCIFKRITKNNSVSMVIVFSELIRKKETKSSKNKKYSVVFAINGMKL